MITTKNEWTRRSGQETLMERMRKTEIIKGKLKYEKFRLIKIYILKDTGEEKKLDGEETVEEIIIQNFLELKQG